MLLRALVVVSLCCSQFQLFFLFFVFLNGWFYSMIIIWSFCFKISCWFRFVVQVYYRLFQDEKCNHWTILAAYVNWCVIKRFQTRMELNLLLIFSTWCWCYKCLIYPNYPNLPNESCSTFFYSALFLQLLCIFVWLYSLHFSITSNPEPLSIHTHSL